MSLLVAGNAFAGTWNYGCMGEIGDRQIIFNRYHLVVAPATLPRGKLADLIAADDPAQPGDSDKYDAANVNSGLQASMVFTRHDAPERKLTLSQTSSKLVSHRERMVHGCRDEGTAIFRNVYKVERDDEPPQEAVLQCEDYLLSTRGGRKCH